LGIVGQCPGIVPLDQSFKVAGRAFTVKMGPVSIRGGTVGDYIDDVPAGQVVVLDNGGRLDATVWGDILTTVAHQRGIAGTVIHGVCRDVSRSLELNYPIFSRGNYMRTGKDRVQVDGYDLPVSLGQVRVEPGDLLCGDADGLVAIPKDREKEVFTSAREIHEAEERIRKAVIEGMRLDEARKKFRYFELQRHAKKSDLRE
jgi:regulator of RNase E activity RraA